MSTDRGDTPASTHQEIVITRVLDAPRRLVFDAWTQPEILKRWWAPEGCTTPFCTVDLRVGGSFHFCMRLPDGQEVWGLGTFREIVEPELIRYTDQFADAEGNPVSPTHYGLSAEHPAETMVTVTFREHDGRTTITLRHAIPEPVLERGPTERGWIEMLDHLAQTLAAYAGGTR